MFFCADCFTQLVCVFLTASTYTCGIRTSVGNFGPQRDAGAGTRSIKIDKFIYINIKTHLRTHPSAPGRIGPFVLSKNNILKIAVESPGHRLRRHVEWLPACCCKSRFVMRFFISTEAVRKWHLHSLSRFWNVATENRIRTIVYSIR